MKCSKSRIQGVVFFHLLVGAVMSLDVMEFLREDFFYKYKKLQSSRSSIDAPLRRLFSDYHSHLKDIDIASLQGEHPDLLYFLNCAVDDCLVESAESLRSMAKRSFRSCRKRNSLDLKMLEDNLRKLKSIISKRSGSSVSAPHKAASIPLLNYKVHGFEDQFDQIVKKICTTSDPGSSSVGIVGIGGSGKTTLASMVFNARQVREKYQIMIWASLTSTLNKKECTRGSVFGEILSGVQNNDSLKTMLQKMKSYQGGGKMADHVLDKYIDHFKEALKRNSGKYLIVLDDVWETEYWFAEKEDLKVGDPKCILSREWIQKTGGTILVTSRLEEMAENIVGKRDLYMILPVSDEACFDIFLDRASKDGYFNREDEHLKKLKKKDIVDKCYGLPLAACTVADIFVAEHMEEEAEKAAKKEKEAQAERDAEAAKNKTEVEGEGSAAKDKTDTEEDEDPLKPKAKVEEVASAAKDKTAAEAERAGSAGKEAKAEAETDGLKAELAAVEAKTDPRVKETALESSKVEEEAEKAARKEKEAQAEREAEGAKDKAEVDKDASKPTAEVEEEASAAKDKTAAEAEGAGSAGKEAKAEAETDGLKAELAAVEAKTAPRVKETALESSKVEEEAEKAARKEMEAQAEREAGVAKDKAEVDKDASKPTAEVEEEASAAKDKTVAEAEGAGSAGKEAKAEAETDGLKAELAAVEAKTDPRVKETALESSKVEEEAEKAARKEKEAQAEREAEAAKDKAEVEGEGSATKDKIEAEGDKDASKPTAEVEEEASATKEKTVAEAEGAESTVKEAKTELAAVEAKADPVKETALESSKVEEEHAVASKDKTEVIHPPEEVRSKLDDGLKKGEVDKKDDK